jgi:hypothetical protein
MASGLEAGVVRQIGALADRLVLEINPAVQACRRMRLSANYLYVHDNVLWLKFLRVAAEGGAVDDFPATGGILLIVLVRSVVISRAHAIIVMHRARSLLVQPTA